MIGDEVPLEKRLAMLAACVLLLSARRRIPGPKAPARSASVSGWAIAARLDITLESWRTAKWGRHEEEV